MGGQRNRLPLVAAGLAAILAAPHAAQATNGMLMPCTGVYACGMGGAGLALPTDASKVATNPALAGRLGDEISVSAGFFHPVRTMDARGPILPSPPFPPGFSLANPVGEQTSQIEDYPDGALAVTHRLNEQWALGVALVPMGGGETKYAAPRTTVGALFGNADRQVRIRYAGLTPTLAWTPSANASYGLSPILGYMDFKSDMLTGAGVPTAGANQLERVYGLGLRVGGVWDMGALSFAASAKTATYFQRLDKYRDLFIGPINLPPEIGAGVTWRATPTTDISVDAKYVMWEQVKAIGGEDPVNGGFGWESKPVIMVGLQQRLTDAFTVRAGWNYGPSPIPDSAVFANALFPAIIEHHIMLGATYTVSPRWEVSVSGYYAPKVTQTDDGTDPMSGAGAGTVISMYQYGAQLGIRWKF